MEFLNYIAKSGGILILFYIIYILVLRKETFFTTNRTYLLIGIICAFILPLITFTTTTFIKAPVVENIPFSETSEIIYTPFTETTQPFDWWQLLYLLYTVGCLFMLGRFLFQLASLLKLLKNHTSKKIGAYTFIEIDESIAPFSFFRYIAYNPSTHSEEELDMILQHEQVHAVQWHSIDLLLANFMRILHWANPIAWFYKKSLEANLEYVADYETAQQLPSKTEYQLVLLKASSSLPVPALTNNFYQSFIKKRIIMLNKSNSNKYNRLKLALVIPALAIFLWSFNVTEVVTYLPSEDTSEILATKTNLKFNAASSNADIDAIEAYFQEKHPETQLKIANRKRNEEGLIIAFDFKTKFEGESSFSKRFVRKSKFKKPFETTYELSYAPENTLLVNELGETETRLSITKDNIKFLNPEVELKKDNLGEKKVSNKVKAPKEIRFPISKNTPPSVFKNIKKAIMETHGVELRYIDQRNDKGEINNLEFYFFENDKEIGTLGLGLYDPAPVEASTFFYSPNRNFGFWNATKEQKLQETQEEKKHYSEEYLKKMSSLVPTKGTNSSLATVKEIRIKITKNTSVEELKMHQEELKELHGIDFTYSNVDFNSDAEITGITITATGKNTNSSHSVYNDDNEPIEDFYIIMNTESGKVMVGNTHVHHEKRSKHLRGMAEGRRERIEETHEERETVRKEIAKERKEMRKEVIEERKALAKVRSKERAIINESRAALGRAYSLARHSGSDSEHSILIDKDTSDTTLATMKKNLAAKGIEFRYNKIKRNSDGEITRIKIEVKNGSKSKQNIVANKNGENPIDMILIQL